MPLTQAQMEKPVLTPQQRRELAARPLRDIFALNQWERAEVLAHLEASNAMIWMKSTGEEDVPFTIESQYAWEDTQRHVIPGGDRDPRPFPFQVGVHVLRNLDQPQFGGRAQQLGPYVPGEPREILNIPGDPGKIVFWVQLPGEPAPTDAPPAAARKRAARPPDAGEPAGAE